MLFEGISEDPRRPIKPGELRTMTESVVAQGAKHLNRHLVGPLELRGAYLDLICAADQRKLPRNFDLTIEDFEEQAARFHYRFVRLHPFCDGNGRLARSLAVWLLGREKPEVLHHSTPISSVLLKHKQDYLSTLAYCDQIYTKLVEHDLDSEKALEWCEIPFLHFYVHALTLSYAEEAEILGGQQQFPTNDVTQIIRRHEKHMNISNIKIAHPADQIVRLALDAGLL